MPSKWDWVGLAFALASVLALTATVLWLGHTVGVVFCS